MGGTGKLKPCPFCGGKARLSNETTCGYETFWVHCLECHSQANYGHTEAEAAKAWNTRADDYRQAAEYWQRMYEETVRERTCKFVKYPDAYPEENDGYCSECHEYMYGNEAYCPGCGAKVVNR